MKFEIGSVVTITGLNKKYVFIDYINHNKNNYGACCNDETYYLFEYEEFKKYISNNDLIIYDELKSKCLEYHYRNARNIEFIIAEDVPPFEINFVKVAQIREKKKKVIQKIIWD